MAYDFLDLATTPAVRAAQEANGSGEYWASFKGDRPSDHFTEAEAAFIAGRDSLYMATVSESGWPYVQHRGGPPGFIRIARRQDAGDPRLSRQPPIHQHGQSCRQRPGRADPDGLPSPAPAQDLRACRGEGSCAPIRSWPRSSRLPDYRAKVERGLIIHLVAFDWNCPQHIVPRFSEAELAPALAPIRARLEALEEENKALRAKLAAKGDGPADPPT